MNENSKQLKRKEMKAERRKEMKFERRKEMEVERRKEMEVERRKEMKYLHGSLTNDMKVEIKKVGEEGVGKECMDSICDWMWFARESILGWSNLTNGGKFVP